jgi:hypothetical protein
VRLALLIVGLGGFAGLGVIDLIAGNLRPGVAAVCLVLANGLLFLK